MKFTAIALLSIAVCSQNFNATFARTANAISVRPQSDSSTYLSTSNMEPSLEKSQIFQTNSQQDNIRSYHNKQPSLSHTSSKIDYSIRGQSSSLPYSTSRSSNQQYLSMCEPQDFKDPTSYNPQFSHSSVFLPLNIRESSKLPLFPSSSRFFRSISRTGRQLFGSIGSTGGIGNIESVSFASPRTPPPSTPVFRIDGLIDNEESIGPSRPSVPSKPFPTGGYSSSGYPSLYEGFTPTPGYPTSGRPSPAFTIPGEVGADSGSTVGTMGEGPGTETIDIGEVSQTDEDLNHPPHIHNLDVECSKTMMTINIEFNRAFNGIIYSKGYYTQPECIYVKQNSGSTRYSFTVNLDSCGTQFINDFESAAGQAYLENVLVLQNEPDIQEVWDTVQSVRCLWEGNINKVLTVNLSVDMLNQEIITFSGDTATAKLDIQIGKGPFAPAANGLVKIGETMTLVVSVEGDPGFDLQVRDCVARDEASTNVLQLTDERGCILKPKLFGAFQKTKDTGNTGASIIAYAFFQAFKFPDVMDLFIECNIELCKTNCEPCPEANQQIDPGRRRRSVMYVPFSSNSTNSVLLSDPVRVGRHFKVIMLDDLSIVSNQILNNMEKTAIEMITKTKKICMSNNEFYITFSLMLSTLFIAITAGVLYVKLQQIRKSKFINS